MISAIESMLLYVREQILAQTGLEESQVHTVTAIAVDSLPDITVYRLEDEALDDSADCGNAMDRNFNFGVAIAVDGADQSATDTLAKAVRKAVLAFPWTLPTVDNIYWKSQDWGTLQDRVGTLTRLTFTATYTWYPEE